MTRPVTRADLIAKYDACTHRAQIDSILHHKPYYALQHTAKNKLRANDFEEQCQVGAARLRAYRRVGK